ncbi:uncharacterized protein TNCT_734341, partial [Trichonephila clavata]
MSVCRTHTIGIRRFIKEIEYDASLIERHLSFSNHLLPLSQDDIWQESLWIAEEEDDEEYVNYQPKSRHANINIKKDINPRIRASASNIRSVDDQGENKVIEANKSKPEDSAATPHSMTNAELMHHFWKLNCRLRFSSYALQRWYASFVSLVLLRCSTYLVHWLGHPATMYDILQFALPLIMLVVLSTAIAEVNFEGQRLLR